MTAVKKNGEALQFASEDLRREREIAMTSVKHNGSAL